MSAAAVHAGVIICEGAEADAEEFVYRLRQLRWKVISNLFCDYSFSDMSQWYVSEDHQYYMSYSKPCALQVPFPCMCKHAGQLVLATFLHNAHA